MVQSSGLSDKAKEIWFAAYQECNCSGDLTKIVAVVEKYLEDTASSERELIANWLEVNYPYFPHIAKEVRGL
jgi:hypothetical protein